MDRSSAIRCILKHYNQENKGRIDFDECFEDYLELLSDEALIACLAWYEKEDWWDVP